MFKVGDVVVVCDYQKDSELRINGLKRKVLYTVVDVDGIYVKVDSNIHYWFYEGRFRHAIWSDYKWNELPDHLVHTTPVYQEIKKRLPGKGREALIFLRKIAKEARKGEKVWTTDIQWGSQPETFMVWFDHSEEFDKFMKPLIQW